jgi:antirestriction protein ArdC
MSATRSQRKRPTTAAEREQRDQERQERLEELHQQLTDQVEALMNGEQWQAMLRAAARFHTYSWRNVLLILSQYPEATRVAGYRTWQSMGRQVRRGEHGIAVLAPVSYRTPPEDLEEADEQIGRAREVRAFKVEYCFDISQTEGEEIPEVLPTGLTGDAPAKLWDAVVAQIETDGFSIRRGECSRLLALGETDFDTCTVTIRHDLKGAPATKTLVHERAHIALGHGAELRAGGCRDRLEVEAESVAFMVCTEAGMATESYSLPYVARWAEGDAKVIAQTAERVVTAARAISEAIEALEEVPSDRDISLGRARGARLSRLR